MIVVTGATGSLGFEVVNRLLDFIPASEVAVSVRDPRSAETLAQQGVEVRHGDFNEPKSLYQAFAGADRLLLISTSGLDYDKRVIQHCNAIELAVRMNVGHVFYTSLMHRKPSAAYVMKAHIDTERILKASGLNYTILQNGVYSESCDLYLGDLSNNEVVIPADGRIAWTSRLDIALGIAALLRDGDHKNETVRLTGPESLAISDVVQLINSRLHRQIRMRIVPEDEFILNRVRQGKTASWAKQWASTYEAARNNELATVDPLLQSLLTHPLRTMEEIIESNDVCHVNNESTS